MSLSCASFNSQSGRKQECESLPEPSRLAASTQFAVAAMPKNQTEALQQEQEPQ